MSTLTDRLSCLRRPRMLVGAARRGLLHYRRERDLPRLVGGGQDRAAALLAREEELEQTRTAGRAGYSAALHVAVLTALLAEAALA